MAKTRKPIEPKQNVETEAESTEKGVGVHFRWMIRRDMPEVLEIENKSFDFPWEEDDFIRCLHQRNCIGIVAEQADRVVGYMVYELEKGQLRILNFAVCPTLRRASVGRQMMTKMIGKLSHTRRKYLTTEIRETNLPAQLFFRSMGFRCVSVLRGFYDDTTEDALCFSYDVRGRDEVDRACELFHSTERIEIK